MRYAETPTGQLVEVLSAAQTKGQAGFNVLPLNDGGGSGFGHYARWYAASALKPADMGRWRYDVGRNMWHKLR